MKKLDWAKYGTVEAPPQPELGASPGLRYRSEHLNWFYSQYDRWHDNELRSRLSSWSSFDLDGEPGPGVKVGEDKYLIFISGIPGEPLIVDLRSHSSESISNHLVYGMYFFALGSMWRHEGREDGSDTGGYARIWDVDPESFDLGDPIAVVSGDDPQDPDYRASWCRFVPSTSSFYYCVALVGNPTQYWIQHSFDGINWQQIAGPFEERPTLFEGNPVGRGILILESSDGSTGSYYIGAEKVGDFSNEASFSDVKLVHHFKGDLYLFADQKLHVLRDDVWREVLDAEPSADWSGYQSMQNDRILIVAAKSQKLPVYADVVHVAQEKDANGDLVFEEILLPAPPENGEATSAFLVDDRLFYGARFVANEILYSRKF